MLGLRLTDRLGHDLRLHFDLHHSQHEGAVVALGEGTDDAAGGLLDVRTIGLQCTGIVLIGLQGRGGRDEGRGEEEGRNREKEEVMLTLNKKGIPPQLPPP